jgi:hypothetical protein
MPLELGEPTQDRNHQLAVWRGRVRPAIPERPERCSSLGDSVEGVEQITR